MSLIDKLQHKLTPFRGILVAEASLLSLAPPNVPLAGSALLERCPAALGLRASVDKRSVEPGRRGFGSKDALPSNLELLYNISCYCHWNLVYVTAFTESSVIVVL